MSRFLARLGRSFQASTKSPAKSILLVGVALLVAFGLAVSASSDVQAVLADTPTKKPINTPTNTPTIKPTNTPTNTPTDTPTNTPTVKPTNPATNTPAKKPTNTPTPLP